MLGSWRPFIELGKRDFSALEREAPGKTGQRAVRSRAAGRHQLRGWTYKSGLAESLLQSKCQLEYALTHAVRVDLRWWLLLVAVDGGGAILVVADAGGEPAAGGLAAVILCACAPFSAIPCALCPSRVA